MSRQHKEISKKQNLEQTKPNSNSIRSFTFNCSNTKHRTISKNQTISHTGINWQILTNN